LNSHYRLYNYPLPEPVVRHLNLFSPLKFIQKISYLILFCVPQTPKVVLSLEGCLTCIDYSYKDYSDWKHLCGIPDRNPKYRTVKYKVACCFLMLIYIAGHESWRSSELNQSCAGTCIRQGHVTLQAAVLIACCGNVSLPPRLIVPPAIT
jgi:hypothetical protein